MITIKNTQNLTQINLMSVFYLLLYLIEPEFISPVGSPALPRAAHGRMQHPQVKIVTSPKVIISAWLYDLWGSSSDLQGSSPDPYMRPQGHPPSNTFQQLTSCG